MYKKTIAEIQALTGTNKWEGYIWMVENPDYNKPEPVVYENKAIDWSKLNPDKKQFNRIQEANLYCVDSLQSIHIKNIDGVEHCYLYSFAELSKRDDLKTKEFETVPASKGVLFTLKFEQLYQLTESPISGSDFVTWQPVCKIFVGFSK